jgi:hypothetical protein
MMKTIEAILEPITGYLFSITRNTLKGWYEMEIGIPKGWVFTDNDEIKCHVIEENINGKLILIAPQNDTVVIDDLVDFVMIIIETNERIAKKEEEFTNKMVEMRNKLEEEAKKFYEELDELKDNSFKKNSENFVKTLQSQKEEKRKVGRPRKEETINTNESVPSEQTKDELS